MLTMTAHVKLQKKTSNFFFFFLFRPEVAVGWSVHCPASGRRPMSLRRAPANGAHRPWFCRAVFGGVQRFAYARALTCLLPALVQRREYRAGY